MPRAKGESKRGGSGEHVDEAPASPRAAKRTEQISAVTAEFDKIKAAAEELSEEIIHAPQ